MRAWWSAPHLQRMYTTVRNVRCAVRQIGERPGQGARTYGVDLEKTRSRRRCHQPYQQRRSEWYSCGNVNAVWMWVRAEAREPTKKSLMCGGRHEAGLRLNWKSYGSVRSVRALMMSRTHRLCLLSLSRRWVGKIGSKNSRRAIKPVKMHKSNMILPI